MKLLLIAAIFLAPSLGAQQFEIHSEQGQPKKLAVPSANGVITRIEFLGLRRVPVTTVRTRMQSKVGEELDAAKLEQDVRSIEATGWFDSVRAEVSEEPGLRQATALLHVLFVVEERPLLAGVEFRGAQRLPRERIEALLAAQGIKLKTCQPYDGAVLWRAARTIKEALAGMGYARAEVCVRVEAVPTAAVRAVLEIHEGPKVEVKGVAFIGNRAYPDVALRGQMKEISPGRPFAGLRGKTIYTPERAAKDAERIEQFYRNNSYAQARVGEPEVELKDRAARRWLPWPKRMTRKEMHITLPIYEGPSYRIERVAVEGATAEAQEELQALLRELPLGAPYSERRVLQVKEQLERLEAVERAEQGVRRQVLTDTELNREAGTIRVRLRVSEAPQYVVRRIEFVGHRRFSDRYYRRRIVLKEGEVFDSTALERGLENLARSGFVRSARSEDIRVKFDEEKGAADITIRLEEIGRQKISLVGGGSGLGNTLGVAYSVFDLLGLEEMLTAHIEGGAESLDVLLGIAKEGIFGTRASLGLSLFQNVVRPRLQQRGWLGGSEKTIRSSLEFARLEADPWTRGRNSWAFRGYATGTGSYGGATLPLHARIFAGDEQVRGFRAGQVGPYVLVNRASVNGTTAFAAEPGGANGVVGMNAEYRVPIKSRSELAAFIDAGTGWLVPRWLGGTPPTVLKGTNGAIRSSVGVEARVRLPLVNQMVRFNYAANPFRLGQAFLLPDGTRFRPGERRGAFGWGLGLLF